jgi:hypothetical protein
MLSVLRRPLAAKIRCDGRKFTERFQDKLGFHTSSCDLRIEHSHRTFSISGRRATGRRGEMTANGLLLPVPEADRDSAVTSGKPSLLNHWPDGRPAAPVNHRFGNPLRSCYCFTHMNHTTATGFRWMEPA